MALDTPGFSLLETKLCDPVLLKDGYPEFAPYEGPVPLFALLPRHRAGLRRARGGGGGGGGQRAPRALCGASGRNENTLEGSLWLRSHRRCWPRISASWGRRSSAWPPPAPIICTSTSWTAAFVPNITFGSGICKVGRPGAAAGGRPPDGRAPGSAGGKLRQGRREDHHHPRRGRRPFAPHARPHPRARLSRRPRPQPRPPRRTACAICCPASTSCW